MESKTFNQALLATARVACAVAIFGTTPVADAREGEPAERSAEGRTPDVEKMERYLEQVQERVSPAQGQEELDGYHPIYCQVVAVLGLPVPASCTPWGPPVPPALPEGDDVAEA